MTRTQLRRTIQDNTGLCITNKLSITLYTVMYVAEFGADDRVLAKCLRSGLTVAIEVGELADSISDGSLQLWNDDRRFE